MLAEDQGDEQNSHNGMRGLGDLHVRDVGPKEGK
jgi:hypothetical protein